MTKKRAESIIGLAISVTLEHEGSYRASAYEQGSRYPKAVGIGATESDALEALVRNNYAKVMSEVMNQQGWRCHHCGGLKPLQIHHIKHRSRGRDDRRENLIALCRNCHERAHNRYRTTRSGSI